MKETGIVRTIDHLGRFVVPREIRKVLDMKDGVDSFEIFMDGNNVVLKKYRKTCTFCGSEDECVSFESQAVCKSCIEKLKLLSEETDATV